MRSCIYFNRLAEFVAAGACGNGVKTKSQNRRWCGGLLREAQGADRCCVVIYLYEIHIVIQILSAYIRHIYIYISEFHRFESVRFERKRFMGNRLVSKSLRFVSSCSASFRFDQVVLQQSCFASFPENRGLFFVLFRLVSFQALFSLPTVEACVLVVSNYSVWFRFHVLSLPFRFVSPFMVLECSFRFVSGGSVSSRYCFVFLLHPFLAFPE